MGQDSYSVDYEALADLAGQLSDLTDEFRGIEDDLDGYGPETGHEGLAGALSKFASNWSDKRGEITENLESCSAFGSQAASCYRDTDEGLASEFSG